MLFEVLVVDQSTDKINKKIVEEYNFIYIHSRKKGLSYSQILQKLSNGKFISFFDDDSYLDENYLII